MLALRRQGGVVMKWRIPSRVVVILTLVLTLVVIFDAKSSLGLVRLRVKKAGEELGKIFEVLAKKQEAPGASSPFAEITDDDIDNLFSE